MSKEIIQTDKAPSALGPYSQGVLSASARVLYCSGQVPLDPATGEIVGSNASEQTAQVLKNLSAVINAGGANLSQVVKTTIYVKSMDDFSAVNEVYGSFFSEPYPARATVEVARLPKNVLVEIDAIVACD
jgi:2-iminobutanoate/2-iminopropanoate deaminase